MLKILRFLNKFWQIPFSHRIILFLESSSYQGVIKYSRSRFFVDTRYDIDHYIYHYGVYKPEVSYFITRELPKLLPKNPTLIDIGAANGCTSILMAEIGKTVAIEPSPLAFEILNREVALNEPDIELINKAVSDKKGYENFHFPTHRGKFITPYKGYKASGEDVKVETVTLEDLPLADFYRIDVQGRECDILKSAKELLIKNHPILSIMVDRRIYELAGNKVEDLYIMLQALGYKVYEYKLWGNRWFGKLVEVKSLNGMSKLYGSNWVAIKK